MGENKCMIYTYAVFLVLILIAQIGAGIAAYMLKGELDTEVNKNMIEGMDNYGKEGFGGVTDTWDIVQKNLKCCGVENQSDWNDHNNVTFPAGTTPDSCCEGGQAADCGKNPQTTKYSRGCYQLFREQFIDNIAVIGGVALGVAGVEFLVVLIACCLGKRMGADQFV